MTCTKPTSHKSVLWNCNSLNFKKQHAILKTSFNHKIDIFLLTEIKNPFNTSFTGYNSIYKHRATLGGGLAILVNTKFSLKRRHDLELSPQNEIIWIEISWSWSQQPSLHCLQMSITVIIRLPYPLRFNFPRHSN